MTEQNAKQLPPGFTSTALLLRDDLPKTPWLVQGLLPEENDLPIEADRPVAPFFTHNNAVQRRAAK